MTHELPKAYDPALIEEKWAKFWVDEHLFDVPTPTPEAPAANPFVQLLPPPNVTGRLHIGHMLEHTQMDILTRWHRMSGDTSIWVPGTDHAGIATQMMVERQLTTEGKTRQQLGREAFTERVWAWKQQYGTAITDQMKRLGASVDWSREYFTMDARLSVAVKEAFVRLYEQGLIYRGAYIVNWDPQLQSAVSDLEVDPEERPGHLFHIRYDLVGGPLADGTASITIATTRPETLLGDTAVVVNPTDERYLHLIGKSLTLPLVGRQIPILADDWAQPEFGTGAVKVTPAHDPNDFAIGQRHNLPSISVMDTQARISLPGSPYDGLDRFEARKRIVADLEAAGHLVKIADHTLTLPISQRTGAIIEPRLSMQWFLNVTTSPAAGGQSISAKAIAAVEQGHITFTPDNHRKTYMEWMTNIHDWCLSRQLWWGHRIPAWHCDACGQITVSRDVVHACSGCGITDIHQETDVLDTWFSSGLLPFTVFGWPGEPAQSGAPANQNQALSMAQSGTPALQGRVSLDGKKEEGVLTPDLAAFYPTQQLVTGFDILFFWVARMIMLGTHFMLDVPMPGGTPRTLADAVPFRNVYIHALVRDADRQKISKTKGNVIDPIEVITQYGTDAVRFTLAAQASPGTDIAFNEARTEGYRAFANKIWNAARFLFMNIDRAEESGIKIEMSLLRHYLNPTLWPHVDSVRRLGEPPLQVPPFELSFGTKFHRFATIESKWILSRLHEVTASVPLLLRGYRFDEAANLVYQFFWGDLCDWYVEVVKLRLNFDANDTVSKDQTSYALHILIATFEASLRLLSPFMPFITEEIWQTLYGQSVPQKSIALTSFPSSIECYFEQESITAMTTLQQLITTVRGLRKDLTVPEKESTPITLHASEAISSLVQSNADMLAKLCRVSAVELNPTPLSGDNTRSTAAFDVAVIYERQIDVPAERERLTRDLARFNKGIDAAQKQLSNEGFIARAPAAIVEGLKKQFAETSSLKQKAEVALAALPPE